MSLVGNLADVAVVDLLQFVHLGMRTGTLFLDRESQTAHISFHRGRIVSAWGPTSPSVSELLVARGAIAREQLDDLIARHRRESPQEPLGALLVSSGAVSAEALRDVITHKVERTVFDLIGWTTGVFRFEIDEVRGDQEISLAPGDVLPQLDINTEMVLIEALRLFDERNRAAAAAPPTRVDAPAAPPIVHVGRPSVIVQVVTEDIALTAVIGAAMTPAAIVRPVSAREAGSTMPGESAPLVLIDVSRRLRPAEIQRMSSRHPRAVFVAIAPRGTDPGPFYQAGVAAVVPNDPAALASCCHTLLAARKTTDDTSPGEVRTGLARLRRVIADLRGGLVTATLSLNLMTIVADSVDRAILFLIQRDTTVALGAFGSHGDGHPLVDSTQGISIPITGDTALARCIAEGRACTVDYDSADFPADLKHVIDRPRSGQSVLFPVLGSRRVIALIYADNGKHLRSIDDVEIVEIATAQVGLAFENELLRRQLDRTSYAAH